MQAINLLENQKFSDTHAHAEPLHVDKNGRAILFTLRPGQTIAEHNAPNSPFYVIILSGQGVFTGENGLEQTAGPNSLLVFDPGENHSVRALQDDLVFIGFLHGVSAAYQ